MPIALDDDSAPEPDVALVRGVRGDYREAHPARPALVVEVADTSLAFDRWHKSSLYARGGVEDYWIVDLIDLALEVHRDPVVDPAMPYGWRYRTIQRLVAPATVAPLALPAAQIAIADLLE